MDWSRFHPLSGFFVVSLHLFNFDSAAFSGWNRLRGLARVSKFRDLFALSGINWFSGILDLLNCSYWFGFLRFWDFLARFLAFFGLPKLSSLWDIISQRLFHFILNPFLKLFFIFKHSFFFHSACFNIDLRKFVWNLFEDCLDVWITSVVNLHKFLKDYFNNPLLLFRNVFAFMEF